MNLLKLILYFIYIFFLIQIGDPVMNFNASVKMFLPKDLNENEKYPMILYVYGAPDYRQETSERYGMNIESSLFLCFE